MKLLQRDPDLQKTFTEVDTSYELSEDLFGKLEAFTCRLYASSSPVTSVNELRYHLYCARKGDLEYHQLPPCQDTLRKHAQRANFQAAIWDRGLDSKPIRTGLEN